MDQIFSFRMVVEKILAKGKKKLYAAFMDLEKAFDRVNWLALWEVLRIYGVAEWLACGPCIHHVMNDAGSNLAATTWDFSVTAEWLKITHMLS